MNAVEIVTDLLQVIIGGLVLGAGLPALFAVGIRLASGSGTVNPDGTVTHTKNANLFQKTLAGLCFGVIIVAIIAGILWITKGVIYESFAWDIFGTEGSSVSRMITIRAAGPPLVPVARFSILYREGAHNPCLTSTPATTLSHVPSTGCAGGTPRAFRRRTILPCCMCSSATSAMKILKR